MDKLAGDGPSDSHKAPELSGIRTVEFLRNWLAERLSRFRFVTEQKGGWQGGNVQPLELVSKEAQLEECSELASPCLRSLHNPTVLHGKSGQSLGCAVGAQTVVAGAKKWRKHSGVPGYTHQKQTLVQSSATAWLLWTRGQMVPGWGVGTHQPLSSFSIAHICHYTNKCAPKNHTRQYDYVKIA